MVNASNDPMQELIPLLLDVQHNLDQDLNLRSMARQSGYSPFHFHRKFMEAVGETPKQHVHRQRLERAAYKLAITDEPILEIALFAVVQAGFRVHAQGLSPRFQGSAG
jgi:AraC family transcriptional regulator